MAVGARWEYRMEVTQGRGKEKQVHSGTVVVRCVGTEKVGGQAYFKCISFTQTTSESQELHSWIRRGANGLYMIKLKSENPESLVFPLPLKVGSSWTTEAPQGRTTGLIEAIETVDLPERSFSDCFRIVYENFDAQGQSVNKTTFWLAKGVGWAKAESVSGPGASTVKQWLTRYSAKAQ